MRWREIVIAAAFIGAVAVVLFFLLARMELLTLKFLDNTSKKVISQSVPVVNEIALKFAKDAMAGASADAIAKIINAATTEVVEKAVGPVVKAAVPKVVAQAKKECCPEKTVSVLPAAPPSVPVMSSEHHRISGTATVVPAPPPPASVPVSAPPPQAAVDTTRIPNPDLPPRIVDGERLLTPRCGGGMGPQLLPAGASVSYDGARVRIAGVQPVKVEVYTPRKRTFEGVSEFSAARGERFNFTFRCSKGHEHYVLLTSNMAAFLPDFFGQGIGLDNSDCCGSTFITQ